MARSTMVGSDVKLEGFYLRWEGKKLTRASLQARLSALLVRDLAPMGRGWLIRVQAPVTPGRAWSLARAIRADLGGDDGLVVEPLFAVTAQLKPQKKSSSSSSPLPCAASMTWSLDSTRTQRAWTLEPPTSGKRFGEGILVAHPDTGYTLHPELISVPPARNRVRADLGFDFVEGRPDPRDPLDGSKAHGTATGSVILSDAGGGERFVAGIAPSAELVPLRVSNRVVHFSFANVTRAIHHAVDIARADLISMSLGGPFSSHALEDAVERATAQGVIVLAAAGNVWPWVVYPAKLPQVIAIAASNCQDRPWRQSASGKAVDLSAPGESVWRAWMELIDSVPKECVGPSSGTSYAVATVAGACALWLAFHGKARLIQAAGGRGELTRLFANCLQRSARRPVGWDTANYGAGLLDVLALLSLPLHGALPKRVTPRVQAKARVSDRQSVIAEYFEPQEQGRALARLDAKLGKTTTQRRRNLALFGDELIFHIATDPQLHRQLGAPSAKRATSRKLSVARGSTELRAVLEA